MKFKKVFLILSSVLILAALVIDIFMVKKITETRTKAGAETKIFFEPDLVSPEVGQTFAVEMMVNTGNNTNDSLHAYYYSSGKA